MRIKKTVRVFSQYISPASLAVLIVMLSGVIILLFPPITGLADNGDYFMMLNSNGLYIQNPDTYNYNEYFQNIYGIRQFFNETDTGFISSNQLFITIAIWLNKLFFSKELFDLRFLGVVYLAALLPAIFLLTKSLTFGMSKKRSYVLALIISLIFGDGMYLIFFNSFYPEAAAYIGLLYFVAFLYYFFRVKVSSYGFFLATLFSVFILVGAYRQYLFLLVGIAVTAFGLLFYSISATQKLTLIATMTGLVGLMLTFYILTPDMTYDRDIYHSVNRGLLLDADKPGEILAEGEVNTQYALLKGTSYYDEFSLIPLNSDAIKENLVSKTNHLWIAASYALNPDEFTKLLKVGVQDMYLVKPNDLGNYTEEDSTEPEQKSTFFSLYSQIKVAMFPKSFGFFILLSLVITIVYGIGFYQGLVHRQPWLCFRLFVMIGLFINFFSTFTVAIIYEGDADFTRHLFLSSVYFDFILLLFAADLIGGRILSDERRFD